jgi:hypothetical protein
VHAPGFCLSTATIGTTHGNTFLCR